jgi:hypothetical protein
MITPILLALVTVAQAAVASGPNCARAEPGEVLSRSCGAQEETMHFVVDFTEDDPVRWSIVNDGVMGGRSSSSIDVTEQHTALFTGFLSLENNGGFASTRAALESNSLSGFDGVTIRLKGDGRRYQLRFRMDGGFDGVAYQMEFETESGEWMEIDLPFEAFQPTFRGFVPPRAAPLDASRIRQMGILIGDKNQGPFALEVDWVKAYRVAD